MCGPQVALHLSSQLAESSSNLRWVLPLEMGLEFSVNCYSLCQACQKWSKDEDHLRLIIQTVGPLPREVIEEGMMGKKFFDGKKLKKVDEEDIKVSSIGHQVLLRKTWFQFSELQSFSSWLQPLLAPDPKARASAYQSANHSFLEEGKGKRADESVEEIEEVAERTSGTLESVEDDPIDCIGGKFFVEKYLSEQKQEMSRQKEKLTKLEKKLEGVVKMLQEMNKKQDKEKELVHLVKEMKEKVEKRDEAKAEELVKLKENQDRLEKTLLQQGEEIMKLKGKLRGKTSFSSNSGRSRGSKNLLSENLRDECQVNEAGSQKNNAKMGTGGRKSCRPDFRHYHPTVKAKKEKWQLGSTKAAQPASLKGVTRTKDRKGGVQLKKRKSQGDGADDHKPKVAKSASSDADKEGFKMDDSNATQAACRAGRKHKVTACGKCDECRRKNCGLCKFCVDKPCFGGRNLLRQKCQERTCTDPKRARCAACL